MRRTMLVMLSLVLVIAFGAAALAVTQPTTAAQEAQEEPATTSTAAAVDPNENESATDKAEAAEEKASDDKASAKKGDRVGVLEEAVTDGVITEAQAEELRKRFKARWEEKAEHRKQGRAAARVFAGARKVMLETLGLTGEQLKDAILSGQTVGEVAAAQGVTQDDMADALAAAANDAIAEAEAAGRIDADQAARLREVVTERTPRMVERMWNAPGERFQERLERRNATDG